MTSNDQEEIDLIAEKYPLVYHHSRNYAAKLIQKSWNRFMIRTVYKYLLQCAKEFSESLNPNELSRIYPEFLESSDSRMTYKLAIKMQGESFPPCLVCRIISESAPSIDGGRHAPKWIPLYNAGNVIPIDQKALVHLFLEALHVLKPQQSSNQASTFRSTTAKSGKVTQKNQNPDSSKSSSQSKRETPKPKSSQSQKENQVNKGTKGKPHLKKESKSKTGTMSEIDIKDSESQRNKEEEAANEN